MSKYFVIFLSLSWLGVACQQQSSTSADTLPYYQEATFTPNWFANETDVPAGFHRIGEFTLQNQLGETITRANLEGKIVIADFFFATCPGICPKMTANMGTLQQAFAKEEAVVLLSHTVTPAQDSVAALADYARIHDVQPGKWHLLTGEREQLYALGRKHYFVEEDLGLTKSPDEFIHTENFVLLDKKQRIRGIYNGLNKAALQQLKKDVSTLLGSKP